MKITDYALDQAVQPVKEILEHYFSLKNIPFSMEECFFLDIETTALSASDGQIYLIGCLYYCPADEKLHIKQFYSYDFSSEQALLRAFLAFCERFRTVIGLYANRFDFAFLSECLKQYHLRDEAWTALMPLDLAVILKPYHSFFHMTDLKRSSLEQLISFLRTAEHTGAQLSALYASGAGNEQVYHELLCHNREDLVSLYQFCGLLSFVCCEETAPVSCDFSFVEVDQPGLSSELLSLIDATRQSVNLQDNDQSYDLVGVLSVTLPYRVLLPYCFCQDGFLFKISENHITAISLVYFGKRRLFFVDYKNYYYVPKLDRAIHKSLCGAIDSSLLIKATAMTCYEPEEDYFFTVPVPKLRSVFCSNESPIFCATLGDRIGSMRIRDVEDVLERFSLDFYFMIMNAFLHP